jgi:hypothetical protein
MEKLRIFRRKAAWGLAVGVLLALLPAVAGAQTETGRLSGTVVDEQGAVLPGATVTLENVGSGATRETVSDENGIYRFSNLPPAPYEVTVQLSGFRTWTTKVVVTVGAAMELNSKLVIGGLEETVNVTAETSVINTMNAEVATTINEQQIRELPTLTRNPYDLVALAGNSSADDPSGRGAAGYALNGQRAAGTNVLLDGGANNDEFRATVGQAVPLDSVQEFSVISSNFSAQYGRATGGIVNVATKSGTNRLRGTAYEFFRDSDLATQTVEEKARDIEKADFSRHQLGYSFGGPIKRDKLHFFSSLEHIRVRSTGNRTVLVPTDQFINAASAATRSFFSGQSLVGGDLGAIVTKGQISGTIAGGPFSALPDSFPVFQTLTYDVPRDAGGGDPQDAYQFVGRVDWSISPTSVAYFRYAGEWIDLFEGAGADSPYEGYNAAGLSRHHSFLGSYTEVWSPKFTSQFKVVYNHLRDDSPLGSKPASPSLYMRSTTTSLGGVNIAFPGYLPFSPGSAIPFEGPQKLAQFYGDNTWILGNHDLRFGGSYVRIANDYTFGAFMNSVETLGTSTGQALDNFLLGQLRQYQVAIDPGGRYPGQTVSLPVTAPSFTRNNRYNEFALYVNDTWSLTARFNVNLGLRYEYFGVQKNTDPTLDSNFYFGAGSTIQQQIRAGQVMRAPDSPVGGLWEPDKNNFAPRVGFAWDLSGDGKTSVRGGYGISYERNFGNVTFNVIQNPPAYAVISLVAPTDVPVLPITPSNLPPGSSGTITLPATSLRVVRPDLPTAYAHFWAASFQREISSRNVVSVEYTGSAGEGLYSITNPNRPGGGQLYFNDASSTTRINTQYTNINMRGGDGYSRYNGISVNWDSRNWGDSGVYLTTRYTFGRVKDNTSSTFSESNNNFNLGLLDPFDPSLDYGWADFDVRHRFVMGGVWQLPFYREGTGASRTLLGGWQVNWLLTAQTGAPYTIYDSDSAYFTVTPRAILTGSLKPAGTLTETSPNRYTYIDLSSQAGNAGNAVGPLGTGEYGPYPSSMSERNAFRRPGRWNVDTAFGKRFRFGDDMAINFRFEVYNLFAHANLYIVDSDTDITSGAITAFKGDTGPGDGAVAGDGQRRMQLGIKFEF